MIRLITLLILVVPIFAFTSFTNIPCIRDPQDSTSCTFSGIDDSTRFYRSLVNGIEGPTSRNLIKKISIKSSSLTHLPKELTTTYSNVEDLDLPSVQLWRFVKIDFASDTMLKKLNVSNNKIHWLTTGVCDGMKHLENLDLSHNVIDLIETNAFTYNGNLKFLNLSSNRIGKLTRDFFYSIRSVQVLKLDNNRISSITGDISGIMKTLQELYINKNELIQFDPAIVKHATYLDISNNNLEGDITFTETNLKDINIRGNSLESLTINNQLRKLDTSDNTKRSFSISFGSNIILKELSLSNLDIINYDEIIKNLKSLYSLEYLDLSQNNLESFNFKSSHLPTSLKILNLRRTDLHSLLNWKILQESLPNLKEIDIQDNFLSCVELPKIIEGLHQANISINGFTNGNDAKFVEKNCALDSHRRRRPAVIYDKNGNQIRDDDTGNTVLLVLVIICLLGYVFGAIIYFSARFDLIEKLFKKTSRSSNENRIYNPSLNLVNDDV